MREQCPQAKNLPWEGDVPVSPCLWHISPSAEFANVKAERQRTGKTNKQMGQRSLSDCESSKPKIGDCCFKNIIQATLSSICLGEAGIYFCLILSTLLIYEITKVIKTTHSLKKYCCSYVTARKAPSSSPALRAGVLADGLFLERLQTLVYYLCCIL